MPVISNYASLTQAILDFTHRATLSSYTDYFIQDAEDRIYRKILDLNEGRGLRWMEAGLALTIDAGSGVCVVPSDYLALKGLQISAAGGQFDLIQKDPQWIYSNYPVRQAQGIPSYIARDTTPAAAFTASVSGTTLNVSALASGTIAVGAPLADPGVPANTVVSALGTGTGGTGTYILSNSATVSSESMTSGGEIFIFGPFPDSAYQILGTYYQRATALSSSNTTTWMTANMPQTLLAACMASAAKFLKDLQGTQAWLAEMTDRLQSIVDADKAEQYASGALAIAPANPAPNGW